MRWIDGKWIEADERFYLVSIKGQLEVSDKRWTGLEVEIVGGSRWWSRADLIPADEIVSREDVTEMLIQAGV